MLSQVNHWMDFAGTAVDCLLLLRILGLRLHKTYLFITLSAVLAVFFDAVLLRLGPDSPQFSRVFIYSRFLYVFVFPAAAWDVFEEAKGPLVNLRKLGMRRLVSSLVFAGIFGFLLAALGAGDDANAGDARLDILAVVCWAASSTASLSFLWAMHRSARAKNWPLPKNTLVWLYFFQLSFLSEAAGCIFDIATPLMKTALVGAAQVGFELYGIAITVWCVARLRSRTSNLPTASENASL
jgi:hypothetical protein